MPSVEQLLGNVAAELPSLQEGMAPYLGGGKRLRARLLATIGVTQGRVEPEALVRYAGFVELIHAGGLCHDDIVDRSDSRRGRPSIVHAYGVRAATSAGLYLMARGFQLVAMEPGRVRLRIAEAAERVARGQAREMMDLYREEVTIESYLARTSDKTAALFALAAWLGGRGGGCDDDEQDTCAAFGEQLGMAFQLADDLRDILGGPTLGRERGTDIREGVYTLPILLTLSGQHEGGGTLRRGLRHVRKYRRQSDIERCCELLLSNGAFRASAKVAARFLDGAVLTARRVNGRLGHALEEMVSGMAYGIEPFMQVSV
jgi:heptaprenyl diphosphate synthase